MPESERPPPLDGDRLRSAVLPNSTLWRRLDVVQQTGSTNDDLRQRARDDAPGGQVLVAEHQLFGRGRLGRAWTTPPGSALVFSVVVRPAMTPRSPWGWLPLAAALSASDALVGVGAEVGIKWPNDVLVRERKIAGILSERIESESGVAVIIGVGINVAASPDQLPTPLSTSLRMVGIAADREDLLIAFLDSFERRYQCWLEGGSDALRTEYLVKSCTVGRRVGVEQSGREPIHGVARDVDTEGRLVVASDGQEVCFAAADVTHVRPEC